ncbi:MAG TPA: hypothetical protein VKV57_13625 [bacterium]|nr:hypothetical protein [bacterium]
MRLDDLEISDAELHDWGRAIEKTPSEEFNLDDLPFGKQVVHWIDETILTLLEYGRNEALHYKKAAEIARRATALSRMTLDPRPITAFKIGERWLVKVLSEFGCRI